MPSKCVACPQLVPPASSLTARATVAQDAARNAANLHCPDEQRLQLYALYKQATLGACATPAPSRLDFVAHAKWCVLGPQLVFCSGGWADNARSRRAWQQVAGLTKRCAMAAYVSLVGQLTGLLVRAITPADSCLVFDRF
jgi:acyl-CoA-binding protein